MSFFSIEDFLFSAPFSWVSLPENFCISLLLGLLLFVYNSKLKCIYLQGWQILAGFRQSPNHQSQIDLVPKALGYSLRVHKQLLCWPFAYHPLIETNVRTLDCGMEKHT